MRIWSDTFFPFIHSFSYPIAVQPVQASYYRTGAKRSAQNYDDANQTGSQFKRVQPAIGRHDTEVWNHFFLLRIVSFLIEIRFYIVFIQNEMICVGRVCVLSFQARYLKRILFIDRFKAKSIEWLLHKNNNVVTTNRFHQRVFISHHF